MRYFNKKNVFDAAVERVSFLFDEFENIVIGMSGGKDSTVVFELAMAEATKRNRLPLKVMWIDQEAEWQGTNDFVASIMTRPDVDPYWFQIPMYISNNASSEERFAYCWEEGKEWMRDKHPVSKKDNVYGTNRFHELFDAIINKEFKGLRTALIGGVRCEESPKRATALVSKATYKWVTWGKVLDKKQDHYTFYPIYDWSYTDVWKAIDSHGWRYNSVYDKMYQHGVRALEMRVSNLHHETAIQNLQLVQEIEPKTWLAITKRIKGSNTIKHLQNKSYKCPVDHPEMFESWREYGIHLAATIVPEERRETICEVMADEWIYSNKKVNGHFWRAVINTILSNDWDLTKYNNWKMVKRIKAYRDYRLGKIRTDVAWETSAFTQEEKNDLNQKIYEIRGY